MALLSGTPVFSKDWVGQFTIDAELASRDVVVGRPVTYTIVITGIGEPGSPPTLSDNPRFGELFDIVGPREMRSKEGDRVHDRFEFQLTLKSADSRRVPPFRWSYFNSRTNKKETLLVPGMDIQVQDRATIDAGEIFASEQTGSMWIPWAAAFMGASAIALSVLFLVHRGRRRESLLDAESQYQMAWQDRARSLLRTWTESHSSSDPDARWREFQHCVAQRCGLDPHVADAEEIKSALARQYSTPEGAELIGLLEEIDASRFGGRAMTEGGRPRAIAWLAQELNEPERNKVSLDSKSN